MNVIPQSVKDGFVKLVGPIARAFIRAGVAPNAISTIGALIVVGSAVAFARGHASWGGGLLLFSGLFDLLDGQVARQGNQASAFGAFYDSTLDRVGESAVFLGIALWFVNGGVPAPRVAVAVALAIAALATSLLVSYTRARAEALGLECKVGIAQRGERFVLLGVPTLILGSGREGALLFWIVGILAVVTAITVAQRVIYVARHAGTSERGGSAVRRDTLPGHRAALRKGT
jgi:phosphatidylinositol phosphate synthase